MSLRILSYIVLLCIALPFSESKAQISLNPVGIVLKENGVEPEETKTLEAGGETYQGAAPLEIRFMANIESPSATLRYEWNCHTMQNLRIITCHRVMMKRPLYPLILQEHFMSGCR